MLSGKIFKDQLSYRKAFPDGKCCREGIGNDRSKLVQRDIVDISARRAARNDKTRASQCL